jgi:hypothetical protein
MTTVENFIPARSDAYMHQPTEASNFNESAFYHLLDPVRRFSLLVRIGNRVNEGRAEVTVLAFLPDGRVGIRFSRTPIDANDAFDSGGLRFEVVEPLARNRVRYDGDLFVMDLPEELEDPKKVFSARTPLRFAVDLAYRDIHAMYDMRNALRGDAATAVLSTGHYQGPTSASGWIELDGERSDVAGYGFRDHSWGPRHWQGPDYWRWLSAIADDDNWFEAFASRFDGVRQPDFGLICRAGVLEYARAVSFHTAYGPAPHYPASIAVTMELESGETIEIQTEILNRAPLRHRSPEGTARIVELVMRSRIAGSDFVGHGFAEFHDRIDEGRPAGMGEV